MIDLNGSLCHNYSMTHDAFKPFLTLFLVAGLCSVFGYFIAQGMGVYLGLLRKFITRTEDQKKNDPLVDRVLGCFCMLSGKLSLLFISLGLLVVAADSLNTWAHADDSDPRVDAVVCLRDGSCEIS